MIKEQRNSIVIQDIDVIRDMSFSRTVCYRPSASFWTTPIPLSSTPFPSIYFGGDVVSESITYLEKRRVNAESYSFVVMC